MEYFIRFGFRKGVITAFQLFNWRKQESHKENSQFSCHTYITDSINFELCTNFNKYSIQCERITSKSHCVTSSTHKLCKIEKNREETSFQENSSFSQIPKTQNHSDFQKL